MALAFAVLSPTSSWQSELVQRIAEVMLAVGVPPPWASFARVEVLGNVVMTVPLGLLASLSFRRPGWRTWTAYAFLLALGIELVQGLLLPAREAAASDVVANTLGVLLGAVLVASVRTAFGSRLRRS